MYELLVYELLWRRTVDFLEMQLMLGIMSQDAPPIAVVILLQKHKVLSISYYFRIFCGLKLILR